MKELAILLIAVLAVWFAVNAARFLAVDSAAHSDAILVLAGDTQDHRYWRALTLLRSGMAGSMIYDVRGDTVEFGHPLPEYAAAFVRETAGAESQKVQICATYGDSTLQELESARRCVAAGKPRSVLLVTSAYHTRRALSVARRVMPQYEWRSAAATDSHQFGAEWWRHREWAKTTLLEWQRMMWWEMVERWKN